MSFTKTYFLCSTSDFIHPPPTGPLSLGAIIRSTSSPQLPLNGANIVPVLNPYPPVVETDWQKTISGETGFGLGVYAQFLQLATGRLGLEVSGEHSCRTEHTFAFDTVTTTTFDPTPEYVAQAVKAPAVQQYLQGRRFALNVVLYLVTGLKLVKGARIKYSTSGSTEVSANIGIDLTALGVTVGPKGHWERKRDDDTGFIRESEFIFAFRVKRLRFRRKEVTSEEYTKGAFLSVGEGKDKSDAESVLVDEVDGAAIKEAVLVMDAIDGEDVYCVPA